MISGESADKAEVIALEKSYWDALKAKDGKRTAALSAPSSLITGAHGVMRVARDDVGRMTEEAEWALDSYAFEHVEVTMPSADVAIVAYTVQQDLTTDGKRDRKRAADSSVWIRSASGWECHAHSETFLG